MEHIKNFTDYLVRQSWQVAILFLLVAVGSFLLRNKSSHWRYLLWCVILAKCLLPPVMTFKAAVLPADMTEFRHQQSEVSDKSKISNQNIQTRTNNQNSKLGEKEIATSALRPPRNDSGSWINQPIRLYVFFVWGIGAIAFLIVAGVKAFLLNRWILRHRQLPGEDVLGEIEKLKSTVSSEFLGRIWVVEKITQPFVWGLWRGNAYLPAKSKNSADVIMHELAHIIRLDAFVNLLQIFAQAIFWFHPFVWLANNKIRAEREKSCDEIAIARLKVSPRSYSSAVVDVLVREYQARRALPSLAVAGPVKNIEERIRTIMAQGKKFYSRPTTAAVITVLVLAAICVPTTVALTKAEEPQSHEGTKEIATENTEVADANLNLEITVPADWQCRKKKDSGRYKFLWQMSMPLPNSEATFIGADLAAGLADTAKQIAVDDVEILKNYFDKYTVRQDSWKDAAIAGLPCASFAADFVYEGRDMVEYRTYILDEKMVYWFVFRIEKELFEKNRLLFDSVVNSLRLQNKAAEGTEIKFLKTDRESSGDGLQILTTVRILSVPQDWPKLKEITAADKFFTPEEFEEFLKSVKTDGDVKILTAPRVLSADCEEVSIRTGDVEFKIKNNILPGGKTISAEYDLTYSCKNAEKPVSGNISRKITMSSDIVVGIASSAPCDGNEIILFVQPKVVAPIDISASDFRLVKNDRGVCNLIVSIKNDGAVSIPEFKLRYYRGDVKNNVDEAGNSHSGWHNAGPIEPGKEWNERTRDFHLPDGRYTFNVVLDYPNEISEVNKNNNQAVININMLNGEIAADADYIKLLAEDFFKHNYRDITARKTIEWGEPIVDANGNMSIRYKYEATIWGKDKIITNQLFVFDKDGKLILFNKIDDDIKLTSLNFDELLSKKVTVDIDKSPGGGERLSVQYAVIAVCEAAGVPYKWDKSAKLAEPQRRSFIKPLHIKDKPARDAIADILKPVGLDYAIDSDGLFIYKK